MEEKKHFGPYVYNVVPTKEISLDIYVPGDPDLLDIQTYLTEDEISAASSVADPLTHFKVFQFFKIVESGGLKTSFIPDTLELHFTYSFDAWYDASSESYWQNKKRPLVLYLEKDEEEETGWASQWKEFSTLTSATFTTVKTPSNPNDTGLIIIEIDELPDPYVGGTGGG